MKLRNFFTVVFAALVVSCAFAQSIARVEHKKIQSAALQQEREILIYTPVDYDWRVNERFQVIYVFDSHQREFFDYTSSILSFLPNNGKSFIIVGITSPYQEKIDYSRNNDFLPQMQSEESKKRHGQYAGNADNFLNFVADEVIPFVNKNYRTIDHNISIGHSLSASFILHALVNKPNLFSSYIAISPNLAYDNERLAQQLLTFDYSKIKGLTYLYLSHADEGIDYWTEWKPAREKVYSFFNSGFAPKNISVKIGSYPGNSHWNTFPSSLNEALDFYFKNISKEQDKQLSKDFFETTIRLKVTDEKDTIYITGNQQNLGDWNPSKVKMTKISSFEREIVVKLQSPAQFKFTKGSWDTELPIEGTNNNVIIKPDLKNKFNFEVVKRLGEGE